MKYFLPSFSPFPNTILIPCRDTWTSIIVEVEVPLIQEGQLSVSGERMCTILVYRLDD